MTNIEQVTVAGGGVLGSQIAYQCAFKGKNVTVYDIGDDAVAAARERVKALRTAYKRDIKATDEQFDAGLGRMSFTTDLSEAVKNANLVIEAIPEKPSIKHDFYQSLAKLAPENTIFASNSSTYVPSTFASDTGRPDKFLNLHFANQIWLMNTAEIMGTDQTDPDIYNQIVSFAREIGMVPIQLHKEQPGYVLNTLLMPLMGAAGMLWAHDVADPQTIDKTWMIATGAPKGPFGFYDMVGLRTAYNILSQRQGDNPQAKPLLDKLNAMIEQGKLGEETGQGFYQYPDPDYRDPGFLKA
ncbi:3-hydroxyacyl-CoA dehydrogenase [Bifidobacterium sp. W8106]|uniref:3-hydroxyacyl-CoA dehydrogenase n=2 Tax=Bifidobacterium TaxID=1678 RepID=A0A6N7TVG9_9BIFI|nr:MULTISPECIES: 3-hydroxyacyl-CoA dehydrogenase [Bifidobacterium]MCT6900712.1 3-hydroxyacyl-CoA dehydrogenase [Bifidobacterium sp.]MBI0141774.1 3-hydroxyacyl-CoA dehydrogenase [Bifidobacterium choladohabitans]MBI0143873.1 3-hydroxyacyl-CoA dehydrogenase [Bifidobacterium choladohabitans]MBI0147207.1 3-hydroxyacyl-CoA dehydrogenase [Bifidobacterium sp. W8104]MSD90765.1 3-hydroxyacyl-CoA dehydrogenase [Bifidobacterium asteroides]